MYAWAMKLQSKIVKQHKTTYIFQQSNMSHRVVQRPAEVTVVVWAVGHCGLARSLFLEIKEKVESFPRPVSHQKSQGIQ